MLPGYTFYNIYSSSMHKHNSQCKLLLLLLLLLVSVSVTVMNCPTLSLYCKVTAPIQFTTLLTINQSEAQLMG